METELFFDTVIEFYNGPTDSDDFPHGVGSAISVSGGNFDWLTLGFYSGEFSHGLMDGQGEFVWPDATNYTGDFKANAISGKGVFEW